MLLKRQIFVLACLVLGLLAGTSPAEAAEDRVYTVQAITVDVTAATASEARERAMAEAQVQAFAKLMTRLTLAADRDRLPKLEIATIVDLVRDIGVEQEKNSTVRYIASLAVSFKPDPIRKMLKERGVAYTEVVSKPVLVIPLYQAKRGAAVQLWEDSNPWRTLWAERTQTDGLVPLIVPAGDTSDMTSLTADQARDAQSAPLKAMARRYDVGDVMVFHAVPQQAQPPVVEVTVTRTGSALQEQTIVKTFAGAKGDALDKVLRQALDGMVALSEENWKQDNLMRYDASGQVTVLAPLTSFADWIAVRRALSTAPGVKGYVVHALKRDMAQLSLSFVGDEQQLALTLAQKDITLTRGDSAWTLTLDKRPPDTPPFAKPADETPDKGTGSNAPMLE